MRIVNKSENVNLSIKYKDNLEVLFAKLKLASFADECECKIKDFQRKVCFIFVVGKQYSKECCWPVWAISMLAKNISILDNKSKDIDYEC